MAESDRKMPTRKVTAGSLGGAITTLLVWVLNTFVFSVEHQITGEIAAAFTTIISFIVGYFVPPGQGDVLVKSTS